MKPLKYFYSLLISFDRSSVRFGYLGIIDDSKGFFHDMILMIRSGEASCISLVNILSP